MKLEELTNKLIYEGGSKINERGEVKKKPKCLTLAAVINCVDRRAI